MWVDRLSSEAGARACLTPGCHFVKEIIPPFYWICFWGNHTVFLQPLNSLAIFNHIWQSIALRFWQEDRGRLVPTGGRTGRIRLWREPLAGQQRRCCSWRSGGRSWGHSGEKLGVQRAHPHCNRGITTSSCCITSLLWVAFLSSFNWLVRWDE